MMANTFRNSISVVLSIAGKILRRLRGPITARFKIDAFRKFENSINPQTKADHRRVCDWAEELRQKKEPVEYEGLDPICQLGQTLRERLLDLYRDKLQNMRNVRVMLHIPPANISPAGNFLFTNLLESLNFIGIKSVSLQWGENLKNSLFEFKPTIFMTSDHSSYLAELEWKELLKYKINNPLQIGLTASIAEYGNTPLKNRLDWAKENAVSFYYSFRSSIYFSQRPEYQPFFDAGYSIFSVEFGANILRYYPVGDFSRDLNYAFIGSVNLEKQRRYIEYFSKILSTTSGFLDGIGWRHVHRTSRTESQKYIYARAKVGLNLHLPEQIVWANELNERTYILAACGVPQLIDNPALLPFRFSKDAFFSANNPKQYSWLFREMQNEPQECQRRAMVALKEVFANHTTLHRAEKLILDLIAL